MPSSGMLRRVALIGADVSDKLSASVIVHRFLEALSSSETSVLPRATRCNIPEDGILHSHRLENLIGFPTVPMGAWKSVKWCAPYLCGPTDFG
jgi:hypothetical protein